MAAAAAGTGTWAAQEKQFPPALLSFFIYNPRFGPREGEVRRGAAETEGARAGARRPVSALGGRGERPPPRPSLLRAGRDVSPGGMCPRVRCVPGT